LSRERGILYAAKRLPGCLNNVFLEAAARSDSKLIFSFLMALNWTGMRSDEAQTARWS
jgi:hypothetical protein